MYQLPNGRVIHISLEEYLTLTDEELDSIARCSSGEEPSQKMYYGKHSEKSKTIIKPSDLDYNPDENDNEINTRGPLDLNNLPDDMSL